MLKRKEFSRTSMWAAAMVLDLFGAFLKSRSTHRSDASPQRILVLRTDGIGDVVVTLPLFAALKRKWPAARLDCLLRTGGAVIAQGAVDRTIISRSPGDDWKLVPRLRAEKYDIIISPRPDAYIRYHLMSYVVRGVRRCGFAMKGGGFLLTDAVPWHGPLPIVELNALIARALGVTDYDTVPHLANNPAERAVARELLDAAGSTPGSVVVGINPYASHSCVWTDVRWSELIARLASFPGIRLLCIGEARRRADIDAMIKASGAVVVNLAGKTELIHMPALISMLSLVVSVDSGPRHIAAAVATPSVVLRNGANSSVLWGKYVDTETVLTCPVPCAPCGKSWCPESERTCMTGITVDAVYGAVVEALKRKGKQ